ncbi:hypothetical protein [Kribbella aluminosa]|uniref:hypothetical protein n=1 Tax=Kribbella aluminosa TaxID=416017 RepID=UPI0031DF4B6D
MIQNKATGLCLTTGYRTTVNAVWQSVCTATKERRWNVFGTNWASFNRDLTSNVRTSPRRRRLQRQARQFLQLEQLSLAANLRLSTPDPITRVYWMPPYAATLKLCSSLTLDARSPVRI